MSLTYLEIDQERSDYFDVPDRVRDEFEDRLLRSWLYHEHALDGVVLDGNDIERALSGQPCRNYCDGLTQRSLRYMSDCIDHIRDEARKGTELSIEFIRDLHVRMCDDDEEVAGRYRQRDTSPGVYNLDIVGQNSISYHFHKFIETYHGELEKYHPIRAASMAHWEFMRVFPYDERSGFVGRLMMNFILAKNFYPPAIIHANDRQAYFDALNGHRTDMVPVLAEGIRCSIIAARAFTQKNNETRTRRAAF